ncbi:MAG: hypothetical protein ACO4CH_06000, partial [Saprospiraceae bacterium]
RSTTAEKEAQIQTRDYLHTAFTDKGTSALKALQDVAVRNENTFVQLMEAAKYCTLGQMTHALYQVGGQYRRNM